MSRVWAALRNAGLTDRVWGAQSERGTFARRWPRSLQHLENGLDLSARFRFAQAVQEEVDVRIERLLRHVNRINVRLKARMDGTTGDYLRVREESTW